MNESSRLLTQKKVQIKLSHELQSTQEQWKRLSEIDSTNTTALDMVQESLDLSSTRPSFRTLPIDSTCFGQVISKAFAIYPLTCHSPSFRRVFIASLFIIDGLHGRKIGYSLNPLALWLRQLFNSSRYRHLLTLFFLTECALAFIEPSSSVSLLVVELVLLSCFYLDVVICYAMASAPTQSQFLARQPWTCIRLILLVIITLDLGVGSSKRYSRCFRPFLLLARLRNVRIILHSCVRALGQIGVVLLLLACFILFTGLCGYLLFSDFDHVNFHSLGGSISTMGVIFTSLPMMKPRMHTMYSRSWWSAVFFVAFVVIANLFLVKLIIAVSYQSYKKHTQMMVYKRLQKRKVALSQAFHLLTTTTSTALLEEPQEEDTPRMQHQAIPDEFKIPAFEYQDSMPVLTSPRSPTKPEATQVQRLENSWSMESRASTQRQDEAPEEPTRRLTLATWREVAPFLRSRWTKEEIDLVFAAVDVDDTQEIEMKEFYQLCGLINSQIDLSPLKPSTSSSLLTHVLTAHWQFGQFHIVYWEVGMGLIIGLSVYQALQVNYSALAYSTNYSWRIFGIGLLFLFTFELVLKWHVYGRREFLQRTFCKLDTVIVINGWIFYLLTSFSSTFRASIVLYNLALVVRVCRVIKVLNLIPPFAKLLTTMKLVLPLVIRLFGVMLSVVYAFGIVAQSLYGEKVAQYYHTTAAIPSDAITFVQFQTFGQTCFTLFQVAMFSGWLPILDVVIAAKRTSPGAYFFFFIYRIVLANILIPIFVGFLVESFVTNVRSLELEHTSAMEPPPDLEPLPQARFRRKRKTSDVNHAMFDVVRQFDLEQLHLLLQTKDAELTEKHEYIKALELQLFHLRKNTTHETRE